MGPCSARDIGGWAITDQATKLSVLWVGKPRHLDTLVIYGLFIRLLCGKRPNKISWG